MIARTDPPGVAEGATGPDGRFAIPAPSSAAHRYVRCSVAAIDGRARAAFAGVGGWAPSIDVGTIELDAAEAVVIRVVDEGKPVEGASVTVWHALEQEVVRIDETATDASGLATSIAPSRGTVCFLAVGPGGRRGRSSAVLPRDAETPIEIALAADHALSVSIVDSEGERPIAGATARVRVVKWGPPGGPILSADFAARFEIAPTGADGTTVIAGLCDGETLWIGAAAPGYDQLEWHDVDDATRSVVLRLSATSTATWPLVEGELPVPPSGTVVTLRPWPGRRGETPPRTGRVEGSRVLVDGLGSGEVHAVATAPDGSIAELHRSAAGGDGAETSFLRPRRITVDVADESGAAVRGVGACAQLVNDDHWPPVTFSDERGRAVIEGLPPRKFRVRAMVSAQGYGGLWAGEVDLTAADGRLDVAVGTERDVEVLVSVNGEHRLPSGLEWHVEDARVSQVSEDGDDARIRFRARPEDPTEGSYVEVLGKDLIPGVARFSWPPAGERVVLSVDLARASGVIARVVTRAGAPLEVTLERWSEDDRRWTFDDDGDDAGQPAGASVVTRTFRWSGLHPAAYRVRDGVTGLASEPIDVRASAPPVEVTLDLSSAYEVAGRVVVPEGYEPSDVRVVAEGRDVDVADGDGVLRRSIDFDDRTFRFWVPGDRPVVIRAVHPELLPAPDGGHARLTGPGEEVVLRLIEGPRATLRVTLPPGVPTSAVERGGTFRALLFADETTGPPARVCPLAAEGDRFRFAGFQPGTYSVLVDVPPFAPSTIRAVSLKDGATELGVVELGWGSSVTLRVRSKEGAPPLRVRATAFEEPHKRYVRSDDGSLRIRGLGAGRFLVQVQWAALDGAWRVFDREIDVDGRTDQEIEVDTR